MNVSVGKLEKELIFIRNKMLHYSFLESYLSRRYIREKINGNEKGAEEIDEILGSIKKMVVQYESSYYNFSRKLKKIYSV
ncbi:hypothetical protein KY306_00300 [Candidatus Woesearchaeota archaeon]|nr:hypothetical protein [Candidatus Woesearchaeota archaeon]